MRGRQVLAPAAQRGYALPTPAGPGCRPAHLSPARERPAPAPGLLARARLLGHHVQRWAPPAPAVHAAPQGALQRVFDLPKAREFVTANPPTWPDKAPKNLLTSYRTMRGIANALRSDPDWAPSDQGTLDNLLTVLTESWEVELAERERVKRAAAKLKAETDARKLVGAPLKKHVLEGDFATGTDTPTGFHSIAKGSATHEPYGTQTDIGNGVYQQSVKGKKSSTWKKKPIQSTFFPDQVGGTAATEDDVVVALGTAIGSSGKTVKYPEAWAGITLVKKGETWYPTGGSDTLMAEDL